MKRLAITALTAALLLLPVAASAQESPAAESPAAPMESPAATGTDVCLTLSGDVAGLDAAALTQGIIDGSIAVVGLGTACAAAEAPAASPMAEEPAASPMAEEPAASPAASPAA